MGALPTEQLGRISSSRRRVHNGIRRRHNSSKELG